MFKRKKSSAWDAHGDPSCWRWEGDGDGDGSDCGHGDGNGDTAADGDGDNHQESKVHFYTSLLRLEKSCWWWFEVYSLHHPAVSLTPDEILQPLNLRGVCKSSFFCNYNNTYNNYFNNYYSNYYSNYNNNTYILYFYYNFFSTISTTTATTTTSTTATTTMFDNYYNNCCNKFDEIVQPFNPASYLQISLLTQVLLFLSTQYFCTSESLTSEHHG